MCSVLASVARDPVWALLLWRATHLWKSWAGDAAEMSLRMTRPPCEILMSAPMPARLEAVPCGVREQESVERGCALRLARDRPTHPRTRVLLTHVLLTYSLTDLLARTSYVLTCGAMQIQGRRGEVFLKSITRVPASLSATSIRPSLPTPRVMSVRGGVGSKVPRVHYVLTAPGATLTKQLTYLLAAYLSTSATAPTNPTTILSVGGPG